MIPRDKTEYLLIGTVRPVRSCGNGHACERRVICAPPQRGQVHHWFGGTDAFTDAACIPHPPHVVLPHFEHLTGKHMMVAEMRLCTEF